METKELVESICLIFFTADFTALAGTVVWWLINGRLNENFSKKCLQSPKIDYLCNVFVGGKDNEILK